MLIYNFTNIDWDHDDQETRVAKGTTDNILSRLLDHTINDMVEPDGLFIAITMSQIMHTVGDEAVAAIRNYQGASPVYMMDAEAVKNFLMANLDQVQHDYEFLRGFWNEKIEWKNQPDGMGKNQAIVDGEHMMLGANNGKRAAFKGHGGLLFGFQFFAGPNAGQYIANDDVWHQGTIPVKFRIILSNNAKRIYAGLA